MLTSMHFASDSVYGGYTENLVVEDVDGDGLDEVIFAFNGGSTQHLDIALTQKTVSLL